MNDLIGKETNANITIDIPGKSRKCTDILFLALIFSAWFATIGIGGAALGYIESPEHIPKGDPKRLTHGMDYLGNICGVSNFTIDGYDGQLLAVNNIEDLSYAYYLPSGLPVCVPSCPKADNFSAFYCTYDIQDEVNRAGDDSIGWNYVTDKTCMPYVESRSLLGYCYPVNDAYNRDVLSANIDNNDTSVFDDFQTKLFFEESLADLTTSSQVILGFGIGLSVVLGFVFLLLLRTPGILHVVIWSFITLILVGLSGSSYYMHQTSKRWEEENIREDREVTGILIFGYILGVLAVLWFATVCCMRKRIVLAIECIKEASTAIGKMPLIIFYPLSQALSMLVFLLCVVIIMIYLAASGTMVPSCLCPTITEISSIFDPGDNVQSDGDALSCDEGCFLFKSFEYSTNTKYAGLYMLFIWFWTSQFILAVGEIIIGKKPIWFTIFCFLHYKD